MALSMLATLDTFNLRSHDTLTSLIRMLTSLSQQVLHVLQLLLSTRLLYTLALHACSTAVVRLFYCCERLLDCCDTLLLSC